MSATAFSELHPFIRVVLGDTDKLKAMYSTDVLNQHLRLLVLQQSIPEYQESGKTAKFVTELTPIQKAKLIYSVAKAIVSQMPQSFSYRTPVFSISRSGMAAQLMAWIDEQLGLIDGGVSPIEYDTELSAILNSSIRFYNAYAHAVGEGVSETISFSSQVSGS